MADIIYLETKSSLSEARKAEKNRWHKLKIVQKIMQHSHTTANCEKCGAQFAQNGSTTDYHLRVPYHFCPDCCQEYLDYIERLKGNGNPDNYWQNGAWRKVWRAWIDYQNTLDQFFKTKEFKKLLKETISH